MGVKGLTAFMTVHEKSIQESINIRDEIQQWRM